MRSMITRRTSIQHFRFYEGRPSLLLTLKDVDYLMEFPLSSDELQREAALTLRELVKTQEMVDWVIDVANTRVLSFHRSTGLFFFFVFIFSREVHR